MNSAVTGDYKGLFGEDDGINTEGLDEIAQFFQQKSETDEHVEYILRHPDALTQQQNDDIVLILAEHFSPPSKYGADFNLKGEVETQLSMVKAMRNQVLNANGTVKNDITTRDMKEVVSASTSLLAQLMKIHERVMTMDRQRAIESAVIHCVRQLDVKQQGDFFAELRVQLGEEATDVLLEEEVV